MASVSADEALDRLRKGNERFRGGHAIGPGREGGRLKELIDHQRRFAAILSCSDSRAPTEIVFDTRLGDLFVIRVAGNVANPSSIASVEYEVTNLDTKLMVVMGHQHCGAVGAAIEGGDKGKNLNSLMSYIQPALRSKEEDVDIVARRSARINAERMLKESDIIREATDGGDVRIITAFFHFSNGLVEFD